jgi:hypothetical protein
MTTSTDRNHYWSMSASDYQLSSIHSSVVHACLDNSVNQSEFNLSLDLLSTLMSFLYQAPGKRTAIGDALTRPSRYLRDGSTLPPHLPVFLDIADALDL